MEWKGGKILENKQKNSILKNSDIIIVIAMVGMLVFMVLPLPPLMLDFLHAFNITLSLMILLVAIYTIEPLNFSVFPSLLLIVTLLRLSLNISGTRLILLHGEAGQMIATFGDFVVGGNYVVGFVIFLILVVIQFVVITSGAQRIAEVAARFTLDAMPGKQMSIDADLSAGVINQEQASRRRKKIEREADFYGAMDGAGKFIKGDAIASVIIIIINILGGFIIGVAQQGLDLMTAMKKFTLLTVGEGLITQIPALIISTAMGIIVTRAASESNLGEDVTSQMLGQPRILSVLAVLLVGFALVPGLPTIPFLVMAGFLFILSTKLKKESAGEEEAKKEAVKKQTKESKQKYEAEPIVPSVNPDPIEIEIGYSLVSLVDEKQGGDLLGRISIIRKNCARESGIVVPPVRVRDNIQLSPRQYVIKIFGEQVAEYQLMAGRQLAIGNGSQEDIMDDYLDGIDTREPVFGLPAVWIGEEEKEKAEMLGYTVIDASSIIATHLSEIIKSRASLLLGRQETQDLLTRLEEKYPTLVREVTPNLLSIGEIQKVLQNLLNERLPIKNLRQILEVLADYGAKTKDAYYLTEQVRVALARTICQMYQLPDGTIPVITLGMEVENFIREAVQKDRNQPLATIEPRMLKHFYESLLGSIKKVTLKGYEPIILSSQGIRIYIKKLSEKIAPDLVVLSYNEILRETSIEVVDVLTLGMNQTNKLPMDSIPGKVQV
ncbi:MAG: flagellar biosynthesis protein FlhA [Candidatus Eremiobacteraeota bacterium]|nr:flagellar biosynthesis protein FlhA [Candidatus Eremiobacteraeota bacterium]